MIALAKLRQDTEDVYSSDDDIINEPKINGVLNHSLKADGSIDLNNSVTARDRRRKHNDSVSTVFLLINTPGAICKTWIGRHYFVPNSQSKKSVKFCISLGFRDC